MLAGCQPDASADAGNQASLRSAGQTGTPRGWPRPRAAAPAALPVRSCAERALAIISIRAPSTSLRELRCSISSGRTSIHLGWAASSPAAPAWGMQDSPGQRGMQQPFLGIPPASRSSPTPIPAFAFVSFPAPTWLAESCAGLQPEMQAGPGAAWDFLPVQLSPAKG